MAYFYEGGRLKVGSKQAFADVEELARRQSGPVYIYDLDDVHARFEALTRAFSASAGASGNRSDQLTHTIHYAMKANSHPAILKTLARLGAGADTVSGGEIQKAIDAGIPPERIIFSGVAKTVAEIETAIRLGIKQINVESPQELERIALVASRLDRSADVAFRLNPDVNPQTHPYITTGFRENKFGMDESFIPELLQILDRAGSRIRLRGLTMHIGSQIFELDVMQEAIQKTIAVHRHLESRGFTLDRIDIGGGLGVDYSTPETQAEFDVIASYGRMAVETIQAAFGQRKIEILTEPGRILVARSGLLVGEVQYIKRAPAKTFAILDTGMHHLIRPALYSAKHRILPLIESGSPTQLYDVVGPICESSDFLAKDLALPELKQGDRVGIAEAGAYGFAMASQYNSHLLPREIPVSRGQTEV